MLQTPKTTITTKPATALESVEVQLLTAKDETEVLAFLSLRPIHTVSMKSLIRDNGLVNPLNRGNFYGCRDINGHLEGVALVGHATLMETVSDRALQALAQVARECPYTHMIMGEQERVTDFWANYSEAGHNPRLACREWLLELQKSDITRKAVAGLRQATEDELDLVMPIQAQLALEESGVDPLKIDPTGFRRRCLRRIRQGRTWVLFEGDTMVFKADVISETNDVIYLEGIWVSDGRRNDGIGARCMAELARKLLTKAKSLCLLANELNTGALAFYRKCGFLFRATYETIFLSQQEALSH
jgi:ribosomal protein S18 acetylase RimI-like enzyme